VVFGQKLGVEGREWERRRKKWGGCERVERGAVGARDRGCGGGGRRQGGRSN